MNKINKPSVSLFGNTNLENENLISKAWDSLHPTIGLEAKDSDIANFEQTDQKAYKLTKFLRTNQDTMINQKPLVAVGDKVVVNNNSWRWTQPLNHNDVVLPV